MQEFGPDGIKSLVVPRGTLDLEPFLLDMTEIYLAEKRIEELKVVNPLTAMELKTSFSQAANTAGKYLAWIEYEILQCEKNSKLEKARITLDESIEAFRKFKEVGMKYNEDFREALCIRDTRYRDLEERKNMLMAIKAFVKNKFETFIRSYYSAQEKEARKSGSIGIAASPVLNHGLGDLNLSGNNFMGALEGFGKK